MPGVAIVGPVKEFFSPTKLAWDVPDGIPVPGRDRAANSLRRKNALAFGWMQVFANTPPRTQRFAMVESKSFALAFCIAGLVVCCSLAGCASPGPPLPPTLNLPEIPAANSVSAMRIGPAVTVRWTTPERTTDRLLIKGPVEAEVCREVVNAAAPPSGGRTPSASNVGTKSDVGAKPCSPVVAKTVAQPGKAGIVSDTLPTQLASGPPQLLAYRVQLKNAAGRTGGPSVTVYAAAGDAPPPIENLHAHPSKAGAVLEWMPERLAQGDTVELLRTASEAVQQKQQAGSISAALSSPKEPAEVRLQSDNVSGADLGGAVDRGVVIGHTYSYIASRVRTIDIGGKGLEVRSAPSATVTVQIADVFPPDVPQGLVAVHGFAGEGPAARPVIDLSWDPNDEPRVAGYRVYRRTLDVASDPWHRISGEEPLAAPAYRDSKVLPGQRYAYRVTAIGTNGLESAASLETEETATAP
jgi:hypothetical protein